MHRALRPHGTAGRKAPALRVLRQLPAAQMSSQALWDHVSLRLPTGSSIIQQVAARGWLGFQGRAAPGPLCPHPRRPCHPLAISEPDFAAAARWQEHGGGDAAPSCALPGTQQGTAPSLVLLASRLPCPRTLLTPVVTLLSATSYLVLFAGTLPMPWVELGVTCPTWAMSTSSPLVTILSFSVSTWAEARPVLHSQCSLACRTVPRVMWVPSQTTGGKLNTAPALTLQCPA